MSAFARKTTTFLWSLFLFPFNTLMQAARLFPGFRQTSHPPILPRSASVSGAGPGGNSNTYSDVNEGPGSHNKDTNMTTASTSPAASAQQDRKGVPSGAFPAAPRVHPAVSGEENYPQPGSSSTAQNDDEQFIEMTSNLNLNDTPAQETDVPPIPFQDVANRLGITTTDVTSSKADTLVVPEVTKAPAVPFLHAFSQTSRLKETPTSMELDGVTVQVHSKTETPEQAAERAVHSRFMREALDMARLALKTNETPVGCVLVYKGRVIARGMNATNVTRNGTRHAELMAISALLSFSPASDTETKTHGSPADASALGMPLSDKTNQPQATEETSTWGDVDPKDGHLYPYGQKLHPSPRVDPSVITECTLYVTVEPCVMCASLLRQFGVKKVYFGAVNDKFGGTGGVFRIHKNSPFSMASAPPSPAPQNGKGIARPALERRPVSTDAVSEEPNPLDEISRANGVIVAPIDTSALPGDGGNIERGYEAEGGWGRDEAVTLLRQFYVQENNRAPVPRKKEGRAARLAALMERNGQPGGPVDVNGTKSQDGSGASTPVISESTLDDTADDEAENGTGNATEDGAEDSADDEDDSVTS
ncbi:uncharacterized protein C8A04DRAFT_12291 [Dichotomopilus funicola]|uniref:CMP/dCMP-type deaminase domain-containing protein n=1 Tax=Dichotomopilus funicola TaxID=1934379 RepID=A0AAN6V285_9PEZI|nr:hypothetical protein C8A04DRAFT_12291 [Dichotomopilus funicola]